MLWDVFISHASEDKDQVAGPLAEKLATLGLRVWLDKNQLKIGDSLRDKIDEGLSQSEYGVIILSPSFFSKRWPKQELDGLMSLESDHEKKILPVWHNVTATEVARFSPLLAGRLAASTNEGTRGSGPVNIWKSR